VEDIPTIDSRPKGKDPRRLRDSEKFIDSICILQGDSWEETEGIGTRMGSRVLIVRIFLITYLKCNPVGPLILRRVSLQLSECVCVCVCVCVCDKCVCLLEGESLGIFGS
jgi:hypothetical protein